MSPGSVTNGAHFASPFPSTMPIGRLLWCVAIGASRYTPILTTSGSEAFFNRSESIEYRLDPGFGLLAEKEFREAGSGVLQFFRLPGRTPTIGYK